MPHRPDKSSRKKKGRSAPKKGGKARGGKSSGPVMGSSGRRATASPQRRALELLQRVDEGSAHAGELIRATDPPLVRELVYGVLRRRLTLDTFHDAFGSRAAAELDAPLLQAVRLGLYQLVFLDGVPAHAAVDQTVSAIPLASHRSYTNGLLRGFLRGARRVTPDRDRGGARPIHRFERPGRAVFFFNRDVFADPEGEPARYLAQVHSHPEFLVARWLERLGEEATVARLVAGNEPPTLVLRPRLDRLDAEQLVARLREESVPAGLVERAGRAPGVSVAPPLRALFASATWKRGLCSVQDLRQREAVEILDPRPGELIWDACAAPGGKTTQIAEQLGDESVLIASDASATRLKQVAENLERQQLGGRVRVEQHDLLSEPRPTFAPPDGFDAILIDAPCSNSAVLDRRPEARWRISAESLAGLSELQGRMIGKARELLAPGGRLIYSVCSFEPEEGEQHGLSATDSPFVFRAERGS